MIDWYNSVTLTLKKNDDFQIKRMIAILQFLVGQCLGLSKAVEMLAKFDPIFFEHVKKY